MRSLNILVVDDSIEDALLYRNYLGKSTRFEFKLRHALTGKESFDLLENSDFSCVILDQNLPDITIKDYIKSFDLRHLPCPIVIITGFTDALIDEEMLRLGIADYVDKSELTPDSLERIILHAIERHAMIQALRDVNEFKERFLFDISNDIKKPIQTLIDYCDDILKNKYENVSPSHLLDIVQYIHTCAKKQNEALDQLVRRSLFSPSLLEVKKREVDLAAEIEVRLAKFTSRARQKNVEIDFQTQMRGDLERLDSEKILLALDCLIDNALKFSDRGRIKVNLSKDEKDLHLTVEDQGIGIKQEYLKKIFSPYTHANAVILKKYGGLGNGLAIAKQMVEVHGGRLEVSSNEGVGSSFELSLPQDLAR